MIFRGTNRLTSGKMQGEKQAGGVSGEPEEVVGVLASREQLSWLE